MSHPHHPPRAVPGFTFLRLLAERERTWVYLARDNAGVACAVKIVRAADAAALDKLLHCTRQLQTLSREPGLLPIIDFGTTPDGHFWKRLPLVDDAPGSPDLKNERELEQFTPLTLRARIQDQGPVPAQTVAQWGQRLAGALEVLHGPNLVHRDVKPGNIFFLNGEPCLGDYGLVSEPGSGLEFRGTEGYWPLEGTNGPGGDLFALGKTLYEAWTGCDRLEFPSLPRAVLEAPDWTRHGSQLNDVILKACHSDPRRRFQSAAELAEALARVVSGERPVNRRRWLATAAGIGATGLAAWLWKNHLRPPARLVWRKVRERGFDMESWRADMFMVDWDRGRIYSANWHQEGCALITMDLRDFSVTPRETEARVRDEPTACFHPLTRELWLVKGGQGEVLALDPETRALRSLGGGPVTRRHFGARGYWNPVTGRVGVFGGYGLFAVTNERSEFNPVSGQWVPMDPDRDAGPWRRVPLPLVPHPTGRKLYLFGGHGSPSGKQGQIHENLRCFNGQFHTLDDVWELDLETNTWKCLLPAGRVDPRRLVAAAWFPSVQGLALLESIDGSQAGPGASRGWLLREATGYALEKLPFEGQPSRLATAWTWALDPRTGELLVLASDGIFRVTAEMA